MDHLTDNHRYHGCGSPCLTTPVLSKGVTQSLKNLCDLIFHTGSYNNSNPEYHYIDPPYEELDADAIAFPYILLLV